MAGGSRKRRPVLIVSGDSFNRNDRYPRVVAVHVTSVHRPAGLPSWEVEIPKGAANLGRASIAKCAELYTIQKDGLESRIGAVTRDVMARIDRALAIALSLPYPRSSD
jgi:mRNA-degrading endonuclease toxin of MazEF toxin-antitoxin module